MKFDKEDIKYLEELYGYNFSTQSHKKLWNYFLEITKRDYFKNKISTLRRKHNIPENGFEDGGIFFESPKLWRENNTQNQKTKLLRRIWSELGKICDKYQLYAGEWKEVLGYYLFYNKFQLMYGDNLYNLCLLSDLNAEEETRRAKNPRYDLAFPIAIKISPYATERDIIDYIKKMFPLIKDFQKPYINPKVKIGKVKRKNPAIQERNNFIYENRNLSLNKTKKLVRERFAEILDYEYIGKIRSEETKKRKEL